MEIETTEPKEGVACDKEDLRPTEQELEAHLPYWNEGIKVPFWRYVSARNTAHRRYEVNIRFESPTFLTPFSVHELFARYKIAPKWKSIDTLFYESLGAFFPQHKNKSITQLRLTFGGLGAYLDGVHSFIFGGLSVASKTKSEVCDKLREYTKDLYSYAEEYRSLFPYDLEYHVTNLYMALSQSDREYWSERTRENLLYSPVFYQYFIRDFPEHKRDQSIADYLPPQLQSLAHPDLVFLSDESPFLIMEWGDDSDISNHETLTKLIENSIGVLSERESRDPNCTNYVYGVLCGGDKVALFRIEHTKGEPMYDCYFISELHTDLYTTTLHFENIAMILRINIILMLAGKLQRLRSAKEEAETSTSSVKSVTQMNVNTNDTVSKSTQTTKKNTIKKCSSVTDLRRSDSGDDEDDSDSSRDTSSNERDAEGTNTSTHETKATQGNDKNKKNDNKKNEQNDGSESESSSEEEEPNMIGRRICKGKYVVDKKFNKFVYLVKDELDDEFVVKYNDSEKKFMKEENLLAKLSNRFLKPIEAFDVTDGLRGLVFPFVERNRSRSLWANPKEFTERAFAIISAINELHEMNIAHSDIKFSNVLFGEDATYLIDFDLALNMNETFVRGFNGTFGYRAPEAIRYGRLSLKMDIYSYGILLFEMASRERLYDMTELYDDDEEKMAQNIVEGIQKLRTVSSWGSRLVDFINRCMTKDLAKRPTAKEVIADPFFEGIKNTTNTKTTEKLQGSQSATQKPFQDITNTWQNN